MPLICFKIIQKGEYMGGSIDERRWAMRCKGLKLVTDSGEFIVQVCLILYMLEIFYNKKFLCQLFYDIYCLSISWANLKTGTLRYTKTSSYFSQNCLAGKITCDSPAQQPPVAPYCLPNINSLLCLYFKTCHFSVQRSTFLCLAPPRMPNLNNTLVPPI